MVKVARLSHAYFTNHKLVGTIDGHPSYPNGARLIFSPEEVVAYTTRQVWISDGYRLDVDFGASVWHATDVDRSKYGKPKFNP